MSHVRKVQAEVAGSGLISSTDPVVQARFPALHDYLTLETYDDGSPRQKSSLTIFREDGFWKGCLNERDQGMVLFVAEERLENVFEAVELLLQEDRPPWRKSNTKGRGGPRKAGTNS